MSSVNSSGEPEASAPGVTLPAQRTDFFSLSSTSHNASEDSVAEKLPSQKNVSQSRNSRINLDSECARQNGTEPNQSRPQQHNYAVPLRTGPIITEALCPPKPKLLDIAAVIFRSRGTFGV